MNSNFKNLTQDSPLLKKLFAMSSSVNSGWRGETNPLANFSSMTDIMKRTGGINATSFAMTPISVMGIKAAQVSVYHDLSDEIEGTVNSSPSEDAVAPVKRTSLTMGAGIVKQQKAFGIDEIWEDAHQAVSSIANMSYRLSKVAQVLQGEYALFALCGMRGDEELKYESHKDLLDVAGSDLATRAKGSLAPLLNELQDHSGNEKVRALTRNFSAAGGTLTSTFDGTVDDSAFGSEFANADGMSWDHLLRLQTYAKESGNIGRNEYPFREARLSGIITDGGKHRMTKPEAFCVISNHENVERLQLEEQWITYQNSLATHLGNMNGLASANCGMYRNACVFGYDKIPVRTNANGVRIGLSLALGQGALCVLHGLGRVNGDETYSRITNKTLRKFMETLLPVDVVTWDRPGSRKQAKLFAVHFGYGVVRPSFEDQDGDKVDYGVIGLHTALPAR